MSEIRICKYCGMELLEDVPHGLRDCHLHAVARIERLIEAGRMMKQPETIEEFHRGCRDYDALVAEWKERER